MKTALMGLLSDVLDPETGSSVLSLGIVKKVDVHGDEVEIEIDGTHPLARHFAAECEAAARDAMPHATIAVHLAAA